MLSCYERLEITPLTNVLSHILHLLYNLATKQLAIKNQFKKAQKSQSLEKTVHKINKSFTKKSVQNSIRLPYPHT